MGFSRYDSETSRIALEALYRKAGGGGGGGITQLTGDVIAGPGTGSVAATVEAVHGASVPAAGALTPGNVLQVTGGSSLGYGPVNLALAAAVTGLLSVANIAPGLNGQMLTTSGGVAVWANVSPSGITELTGDVDAGPGAGSVAATVVAVHGASVPAAGALVTGNTLQVTGPSSLGYGPINLAGGANYVTGNLSLSNVTPGSNGQFLATMGGVVVWATPTMGGITQLTGDVDAGPGSGAQSATVLAVHGASVPASGALVTGNVLQVSGSSALSYGPLNLAGGANYITGNLPAASVAPGTNGQVLTTSGGVATWAAAPATGITELTGDVDAGPGTGIQAASVIAVHGATVPVAGALTMGNVLQVSGTSTLDYAPINLAGGVDFISGELPTGNIAPGTNGQVLTTSGGAATWAAPATTGITQLTGDVNAGPATGSASSIVEAIHGASVPVAGALTTGNVLQVSGPSALSYGPVNLAGGANFVTGDLPVSNVAPGTNGQVLTTSGGVATWAAPATTGITQLTGDVNAGPGTGSQAATVEAIHGASVPAAGALTIGNVLQVTGASALSYAPVNLAGGGNFVTGELPVANVAPGANGQVLTTTGGVSTWAAAPTTGITQLTGDVTAGPGTGSQAATVQAVHGATVPAAGALTPGNVLQVSGASALTYAAVNLAGGANFVTGNLPITNIAPSATNGQVLTTVGGTTTWATPASTGITQLTGDVNAGPGTGSVASTVLAIHGATVPVAGALTTGNVLQVTGASALSYAAVNLAGGANFVTGNLPVGNIAPSATNGQVLTTVGGATAWATLPTSAITQLTGDVDAGPGTGAVAATVVSAQNGAALFRTDGSIYGFISTPNETGYALGNSNNSTEWTALGLGRTSVANNGQVVANQYALAYSFPANATMLNAITGGEILFQINGNGTSNQVGSVSGSPTSPNWQFGQTQAFGGGVGIVGINNATTVPTALPGGGVVLYGTVVGATQFFGVDAGGIGFPSFVSNPVIVQASSASANGSSLGIAAQSVSGGVGNGGNLILASGSSVGGTVGSVALTISGLAGNAILTVSGNGLTLGQDGIAVASTGTTTLTAAQYQWPELNVNAVALTGNVTLVFPNVAAIWVVDLSQVTFGANSFTFQSGTATATLTSGGGSNVGGMYFVKTTGSNGITIK
jgi:hypothetical protein